MKTEIPPLDIPVQWGDMDAFQHVNNTVYLRWCESARIAFFEQTGLLSTQKSAGVGPILASIQCKFRAPVVFPNTVRVQTRILRLGTDDFELEHLLYVEATKVAEVQERVVIFDYKAQKKAAFPEKVKAAFEARL